MKFFAAVCSTIFLINCTKQQSNSASPQPAASTELSASRWTSGSCSKTDDSGYVINFFELTSSTYVLTTKLFSDAACKISLMDRIEEGTYRLGGTDTNVPSAKQIDLTTTGIFGVNYDKTAPNPGMKAPAEQTGKPKGTLTLGLYRIEGSILKINIDSSVRTRPTNFQDFLIFTRQ